MRIMSKRQFRWEGQVEFHSEEVTFKLKHKNRALIKEKSGQGIKVGMSKEVGS